MARFKLTVQVTETWEGEFEAPNLEEAREKAEEIVNDSDNFSEYDLVGYSANVYSLYEQKD